MLPAVGLLRTVPCPFYVAGLCDRPHCCFSHTKRDISAVQNYTVNKHRKSIQDETNDSDSENEEVCPTSSAKYKYKLSLQKSSDIKLDKEDKNLRLLDRSHHAGSNIEKTEALDGSEAVKRKYSEAITKSDHKCRGLERTKSETTTGTESAAQIKKTHSNYKHLTAEKDFNYLDTSNYTKKLLDLPSEVSRKANTSSQNRTESHKTQTNSRTSNEKEKNLKYEGSRSRLHSHSGNSKSISPSKLDRRHSKGEASARRTGSGHSHSSRCSTEKPHTSRHDKNKSVHKSKEGNISLNDKNENGNSLPKASDECIFDENFEEQEFSTFSSGCLSPENIDSDEDDPIQIALECLEMFNSYKADESKKHVVEDSSSATTRALPTAKPVLDTSLGKKRIAHIGADDYKASRYKPKPKISPVEQMQQRYQIAQQNKLATSITLPVNPISTLNTDKPVVIGRKRISHVANVSGLLKPKLPESSAVPSKSVASAPTPYVVQTAQKGQSRVAHTVQISTREVGTIPRIAVQSIKNSKVPLNVRQKILEQLFQACVKIYPDEKDASERALTEEKELVTRCSSKPVYMCAGTNAVARLRRELTKEPGANLTSVPSTPSISHQSVLCGSVGSRVSWSIETSKKAHSSLSSSVMYQRMKKYILNSTELESNGYPRPDPSEEKGKATAKPRSMGCPMPSGKSKQSPFERTCERCKKIYHVNKDGFPVKDDQCVYHHGRKYNKRINGISEGYYNCCSGDASAPGCAFAPCHVSGNNGELQGFVTAVKANGTDEIMGTDPWDIVAIDCEMIYTTSGCELARATFIGSGLQILYDELVKPIHPILDYNTRFSGITEDMLMNTTTVLTDVQAVILTHLKPNAILIGHSLESDLLAMKLIHHTVLDTSVIFPHKMGPPYKRALRNLCSEFINKIIQEGEGGHDSAEDAKTAMELVLWKLNEDLKTLDSKQSYVGKRKM